MSLPVEDVLAIQKLLADYNHAIDAGDGDGFAGTFVEDGTLDVGHGVTEGRAALKEFAGALPTMVPGIRHLISNLSIDCSGDRVAMATNGTSASSSAMGPCFSSPAA